MENSLEFIEKLGFKDVGKWELGISYKFEEKQMQKKFIYAFVVDDGKDKVVKYIGNTVRTLKGRMDCYRNEIGGSTNSRIKNEIVKALKSDKKVLIYALPNDEIDPKTEGINELITYTTGLEEKLIDKLDLTQPDCWNIQRS
ncbi:MAG: hypothetical protein FWF51_12820 [Chitinivibrionia bacterium]|nr:hypothetical protein [Chitinivibrionia bacterium]